MTRGSWFAVFCAGEGGLIVVAAVLGWFFGLDPWLTWTLDWRAVGFGLVGVVPPLGLLIWVVQSHWRPVVDLRERVEGVLREVFVHWNLWQFAVVSLLAGLGEECLFRGIVQAGFGEGIGPLGGLLVASILFGLAHPISVLYVLLAGTMGLWFGVLWNWSDSLVAPVLAHALYDFIALAWLVNQMKVTGRDAARFKEP